MRWFGPKPFSPACEDAERMNTPIGAQCDHCEEAFVEGDEGYLFPLITKPGQITTVFNAEGVLELLDAGVLFMGKHVECHLVGINGHVRCILTHGYRGKCPREAERDPPGMTKREAAHVAEMLWHMAQRGELTPARKQACMEMFFPTEVRERDRRN